jgi:hypothetical protein
MSACLLSLMLALQDAQAQTFEFTRAIPQMDPAGAPLAEANTTFADGTDFQPAGDEARSSKWAWRPYGTDGILSSLGPTTTTLPTSTKELVTTVSGLEPGAEYVVKALFWSPDTSPWGVRADLTYAHGTRTNQWFEGASEGVVAANLFSWATMPSVFREGGRSLLAAPLGVATADQNGRLKIFIHDLPTADSNRRTWYQGVAVGRIIPPSPHVIDSSAPGVRFNRGVRGLALADVSIDRGEYHVGIPRSLEVARGSAIRGVATGLAADLYDWRKRNGQPRPPTLHFLRYSRDFKAELYLGANIRGLVEPDPAGGFLYYDTQPSTLASLAADWVRYVNHIVPTYRQGDVITDSRDAAILESLTWSSSFPGDSFDKLLAQGEPPVPWIEYWEIGNEPTIGVGAFSVNNSYTMDAAQFHTRYGAVAKAIKVENPKVKVGPTLVNGSREAAHLAAIISDATMPVDFITYHPYEKMGLLDKAAEITLHLGSIYSRQLFVYNEIRKVVSDNGRDPAAIEYAATEVNVSNWDTNDTEKEARMAHALGTVETVFSHARLGLTASHYWIWPTHRWDGTEYPVFKAYEKLRDHMGDTLVSINEYGDYRLYTTRDSRTGQLAVWMLNFSNDHDGAVEIKLENLPKVKRATLLRLADKSGATSLLSINRSSDMPGGRAINVDWTSSDLTGQDLGNLQLTLPAATLSVLVIEPGLGSLIPSLIDYAGEKRLAVTFRPLPHASDVRYRLIRSGDLVAWELAAEAEPGMSEWLSIADTLSASASQRRFFRIEMVRD